jgi:integrase/recombinase XerD
MAGGAAVIKFSSWLAPYFRRFVAVKRAGGAAFETQAKLLARFDQFVGSRSTPPLRRDILVRYLASLAPLFPRSRENAVGVVWTALAHAQRQGAPVELLPRPPAPPGSLRKQRARIVTLAEFERIFVAAHRLAPSEGLRSATTATLIGLLYTTGIRIGEALALDIADLDIEAKILTVHRGKFGKSRWLPVYASTVRALQRYIAHPQRGVATEGSVPLFVSGRRHRLLHAAAHRNFRAACRFAAIATPYPRLHDLRHSFAVGRVAAWYEQRRDVDALLPILSTYLGHVSVENTRVYLSANGLLLERAATLFAHMTSFLDEVQP